MFQTIIIIYQEVYMGPWISVDQILLSRTVMYFFLYFEPFCVPCGRFFLWYNVPRGSYTGQRLMTGN